MWPIKQEIELVLRVVLRDSSQRLKGEPTDALQFIFEQQSRIYCNLHLLGIY